MGLILVISHIFPFNLLNSCEAALYNFWFCIYECKFSVEKSSSLVAEQCAWALGNVAGEGEELRNVLLSQGALVPLAKIMLPNKGSIVTTAAWALSNLIKVRSAETTASLVLVIVNYKNFLKTYALYSPFKEELVVFKR